MQAKQQLSTKRLESDANTHYVDLASTQNQESAKGI